MKRNGTSKKYCVAILHTHLIIALPCFVSHSKEHAAAAIDVHSTNNTHLFASTLYDDDDDCQFRTELRIQVSSLRFISNCFCSINPGVIYHWTMRPRRGHNRNTFFVKKKIKHWINIINSMRACIRTQEIKIISSKMLSKNTFHADQWSCIVAWWFCFHSSNRSCFHCSL